MASAHIFVETNFLFGVFRMPSKRHRNALALRARFDAGEVKLYVPYLCVQEARHLIGKSLPSNRCSDLLEFHRFAAGTEAATWDFDEVKKLLDAASGEVSRTKAVYHRNSLSSRPRWATASCTALRRSSTFWKHSTWTMTI